MGTRKLVSQILFMMIIYLSGEDGSPDCPDFIGMPSCFDASRKARA